MNPLHPYTLYLCAALVITNVMTVALWRSSAHEVAVMELRGEIAAEKTKATIEEQKQITEDTTNGWKAALDSTRDFYARRLREHNVQPMPGISGPAGGVDGLPTDALALAAQCAETTLNYENLQRWVQRQRELK